MGKMSSFTFLFLVISINPCSSETNQLPKEPGLNLEPYLNYFVSCEIHLLFFHNSNSIEVQIPVTTLIPTPTYISSVNGSQVSNARGYDKYGKRLEEHWDKYHLFNKRPRLKYITKCFIHFFIFPFSLTEAEQEAVKSIGDEYYHAMSKASFLSMITHLRVQAENQKLLFFIKSTPSAASEITMVENIVFKQWGNPKQFRLIYIRLLFVFWDSKQVFASNMIWPIRKWRGGSSIRNWKSFVNLDLQNIARHANSIVEDAEAIIIIWNNVGNRYPNQITSYLGNPFSRHYSPSYLRSTVPFEVYITSIVFENFKNITFRLIPSEFQSDAEQRVGITHQLLTVHSSILVGSKTHNFITCDGWTSGGVSFIGYLNPYQPAAWIAGIASFGLTVLAFNVMWPKLAKEVSFTMLLVSYLLENSSGVFSKLATLQSFRCAVGGILLTVVVLSNAYRGIVTTDLTAPRSLYRSMQGFDDLLRANYSIYTPLIPNWRNDLNRIERRHPSKNCSKTCLMELINPDIRGGRRDTGNKFFYYSKALLYKFSREFWGLLFRIPDSNKLFRMTLKLIASFKTPPSEDPTATFHTILSECNQTAFMDSTHNLVLFLQEEWNRSRPPKNIFYTGRQDILPRPIYWYFPNILERGEYFPRRAAIIVHSGIFHKWEQVFMRKNVKNYRRLTEMSVQPQKLGFSSNVVAVFFLFLLCTLACILQVILERQNLGRSGAK